MNQGINLGNNDLGNGYIYQKLVDRIDALDKQNKEIMQMIQTATSDMKISVKDYVSILKEIENCVTRKEFEMHAEDNEIHLHRSKTLESEIEAGKDDTVNEEETP